MPYAPVAGAAAAPGPGPEPPPLPFIAARSVPSARLARDVAPVGPKRSLETLIGQNWASWVGAVVLFLGVVFFLKYAWDQGWIRPSPAARVAAAVTCGVMLGGAGEWLYQRRRMRGLAAALYGAGVSVVIASFFGAHAYFDPPVLAHGPAFAAVVVTALLAIVAALHIDAVVVALIGLIGAYLAPNLLGGGHDRSAFFMLYLGTLAITALGLAQFKRRWLALRWLALLGTYAWLALWWNATGRRGPREGLAMVAAVGFAGMFVAEAAIALIASSRRTAAARDGAHTNVFDAHAVAAALLAVVDSMLFLLGTSGRAGAGQVTGAALAMAAMLAVPGVLLCHTRSRWAALRWAVVAGSYAWLAMWWHGPGREAGHATLAAAWALALYALFLFENLLTLRRFGGTVASGSAAAAPHAPPRAPLIDTVIAASSLVSTAGALAALLWVWGTSWPVVVGAVAIVLALVQGSAALVARSRDYFVSSILQSMALLTLAAPLVLDRFAVTLAWMIMAALLALAAWQLNLPKARRWAAALLLLALVRLVAFDGRNPMLRAVQFVIFDQSVTRWLMTAWTIALLYHLLAWLRPGAGRWPALEAWIDRHVPPPSAPTFARAAPSLGLRAETVLDYASHAAGAVLDPARQLDLDRAGTAFAAMGTLIFCGFALAMWHGPVATLLLVAWFGALLALSVPGRRIGYGVQAWVLGVLVSSRWLIIDNLVPIQGAWKSGGTLPAITNLPALCGALLAVAIIVGIRMLPGDSGGPAADARGASGASALSMHQLLIVWAITIVFALLNFETIRFIDTTGVGFGDRAIVKQVALSVLWAACGFAGVVFGFRRHVAPARWAALALLGVTLAKILVMDMAEVKAIWRILSFVAVGLLLLCVSFVYHKQTQAPTVDT